MKSLITKENKIEYIKALDWYIKEGHKSHNRFGICYHFCDFEATYEVIPQ